MPTREADNGDVVKSFTVANDYEEDPRPQVTGVVDLDAMRGWLTRARGTLVAGSFAPSVDLPTIKRQAERTLPPQPAVETPLPPPVSEVAASQPTEGVSEREQDIAPARQPVVAAPTRTGGSRIIKFAIPLVLALTAASAAVLTHRARTTSDQASPSTTVAAEQPIVVATSPSSIQPAATVAPTTVTIATSAPASSAPATVTTSTTIQTQTTPPTEVATRPVPQSITPLPNIGADVATSIAIRQLGDDWAGQTGVPLVLSYHDIAPESTSTYTVTPAQFADQMSALAALNVHTLTAAEFADYAKGKPVPPRSVLITFDDGTRGVWKYADKVLEQLKFHAVSFIVTGFVGTRAPYYMTWDEISRLSASGRWDFENHTHLAHFQIPIDAAGAKGSFLANLAWLPGQNRLETVAEYQARITLDLDRSVSELTTRGYGRAGLFAFPYSDYGSKGNDPGNAAFLEAATKSRFNAAFNDDRRPLALGGPFHFNRLNAEKSTTVISLVENLRTVLNLTRSQTLTPPK